MTGTVYAPAAQLAESGNAQLNAAVIVDTMTVSGNGIANTLALAAPSGTVAYTPTQIRAAYGISKLSLDGTGQTIAIVDAYDDPSIYQALDAFDSQFGLVVVLDRAQPVWPGHVAARNRPQWPRHQQLGTGGSTRRRVGACHRPRGPDHPG
jgi:subtilase family serine protease